MSYTIGEILQGLMQQPKFKEKWIDHLIKSKWGEILGKQMALHVRPYAFKDSTLKIKIDDEKWVAAFEELKGQMIEKINKSLGCEEIKGVEVLTKPATYRKRNKKCLK